MFLFSSIYFLYIYEILFFSHASCFISVLFQFEPCPSALDGFDEIIRQANMKEIIIFLDYDGTLLPIVNNPDKAYMSDEVSKCVNVPNALNSLHLIRSGASRGL